MSPAERSRFMASIPQDPDKEAHPPEGQHHDEPIRKSWEALEHYFRKRGRAIFLASDLRVFYPGEPWFAPDLIAVLDHVRSADDEKPAWVVNREERGIDFVLKVHVFGDRKKDAVHNVGRYARLGIPEYFLFDRPARRLYGWHLAEPPARVYHLKADPLS